jgi:hypothetical protein
MGHTKKCIKNELAHLKTFVKCPVTKTNQIY